MWPAKVIRLDPDCVLEAHRARRPSTRKQYQPFLLVTVHGALPLQDGTRYIVAIDLSGLPTSQSR